MTDIALQPLAQVAFARYGDVIAHAGAERRRDIKGAFTHGTAVPSPAMWVNRLAAHPATYIEIDLLECHPASAQSLIPLSRSRFAVIVCEPDPGGQPDLATLSAFVTDGGQGVCYRPGCWHFAFTPIDSDAQVAVVFASRTGEGDTQFARLQTGLRVRLEPTSAEAQS